MIFIELPIFAHCASDLFSDEDIADLQGTILEQPAVGDLILSSVPLAGGPAEEDDCTSSIPGCRGFARIAFGLAGLRAIYLGPAYRHAVFATSAPGRFERNREPDLRYHRTGAPTACPRRSQSFR